MKLRRSGISVALVTTALFFAIAAPPPSPTTRVARRQPAQRLCRRTRASCRPSGPTARSGIFYPALEPGRRRRLLPCLPGRPSRKRHRTRLRLHGNAGPFGLDEYTPGPHAHCPSGRRHRRRSPETGHDLRRPSALAVTQTTTYVNGAQEFRVRWDVNNIAGGSGELQGARRRRLLLRGRRRRHRDLHRRPAALHRRHEPRLRQLGRVRRGDRRRPRALVGLPGAPFGSDSDEVWGKIEEAASSTAPTFDDSVLAEAVDNAGGVEWDQDATGPGLAPGATRSFELVVRSAVPSALQLNPTNAARARASRSTSPRRPLDSNGQPYAGKTLRYSIAGPNAATGSATLSADRLRGDHRSRHQSRDRHGDGVRRLQRQRHPRHGRAAGIGAGDVCRLGPAELHGQGQRNTGAGGESGKPLVINVIAARPGRSPSPPPSKPPQPAAPRRARRRR